MSQSLGRGLSILIELGDRPHNLDELAGKLGVHKTTVLRLLRTLEADRFVRRDENHRFHLGPRLSALAGRIPDRLDVRDVAAPHLARLNAATGRTAHLVTGPPALLDELDRAAGQGRDGQPYVAAPIRDASGRVVAAVSLRAAGGVTGPPPDLLATARAISADCGHPGRPG
jgi:DNA-binding IclR family transcriptional regulator